MAGIQTGRPVPQLTTGRVVVALPEVTRQNARAIVDYYSANKERLVPHDAAWPANYLTEEYWLDKLAENFLEFSQGRSVRCFLYQRNVPEKILGTAALNDLVAGNAHFCHLSCSIDREWEGKKLMKEALQALTSYGFSAFNLHCIRASYLPTNERCAWLLRSLGFNVEGYARDFLLVNGKWQDHVLAALINPNWTH